MSTAYLYNGSELQISPIICIVFNMIIVRIGLAADGTLIPEPTQPVPAPTRASDASRPSAAMRRMVRRQQSDTEMKDINITVEIAQFVHEDLESRSSRESQDRPKTQSDRVQSPVSLTLSTSPTRHGFGHVSEDGVLSMLERSMSPQGGQNGSQIHVVAL